MKSLDSQTTALGAANAALIAASAQLTGCVEAHQRAILIRDRAIQLGRSREYCEVKNANVLSAYQEWQEAFDRYLEAVAVRNQFPA